MCAKPLLHGLLLVPGERIELSTNGLQNLNGALILQGKFAYCRAVVACVYTR